MSDVIQSCEYRGYTIEVVPTYDPLDPFEDGLKLGHHAFFHRTYRLGDGDIPFAHTDFGGWDAMREYIEGKRGLNAICLPVYMYDHSGITINTTGFSCGWDSGQIGFTYATRQDIREWYGCKYVRKPREEQALELLKSEIELLDKHIRGEVYDWRILQDDNHVESCGQYYGEEEAIQNAKHYINGLCHVDNVVEMLTL